MSELFRILKLIAALDIDLIKEIILKVHELVALIRKLLKVNGGK